MSEIFLQYGNIKLVNIAYAKAVYDEVLVEDTYRIGNIPQGALVFDVGAFCGEFSIACAMMRGCTVWAYEPSPVYKIAQLNVSFNVLNNFQQDVRICNLAIAKSDGVRPFDFQEKSPTSSGFGDSSGRLVQCATLKGQIDMALELFGKPVPVVVKLDCEGAEREIFEDESWLPSVSLLMIEFHNKDGQIYKGILERNGFEVEFNDPNPEAIRATIYAKMK